MLRHTLCMVETPSECTEGFAGLCSWGKTIVKVQHELNHAVLFQLLKPGVICCQWSARILNVCVKIGRKGGKGCRNLKCTKNKVGSSLKQWVFYCYSVCYGWVWPKTMAACRNYYALISFYYYFITMSEQDCKLLLEESYVALQLNSSCFHEEWQPSSGKKGCKANAQDCQSNQITPVNFCSATKLQASPQTSFSHQLSQRHADGGKQEDGWCWH